MTTGFTVNVPAISYKWQVSTSPGQSGAPVYRSGCKGYCVIAIHTQGVSPSHPNQNAGTRITQIAFNNLLAWR
jgi:glutamyl endopeptidase